jgi:hypothetical protein
MVGSWNAFFLPLLVLNNTALWTLPLGIMQFQGQFGSDWSKRPGASPPRGFLAFMRGEPSPEIVQDVGQLIAVRLMA